VSSINPQDAGHGTQAEGHAIHKALPIVLLWGMKCWICGRCEIWAHVRRRTI